MTDVMTDGERVIQGIKDGKTLIEIAREMGRSPITINRWVKQIRETGIVLDIKQGRPKKKLL